MNRKPFYNGKKRVISVSGGRWVAQHFLAGPRDGKGQNHSVTGKGKDRIVLPHIDPWQDIAPPTADKSAALARIVDNQQARV